MSLFVDTSMWYAAADSSDVSNALAKGVLSGGEPLVTSDHVLIETWTLIRHRIGRRAAERFWQGLRDGAASVETVGAADLESAWQIGLAYRDQDWTPVKLKQGENPVLIKMAHGVKMGDLGYDSWRLYFRLADANGLPAPGIRYRGAH